MGLGENFSLFWVGVKILGRGENFGFGQKFWVRQNFSVLVKILSLGENFR